MRRVATLVARGAMPEEVFAAVTEEVGRLFSVEYGEHGPLRARPYDDLRRRLGQRGDEIPVGSRWSLGGTTSARSCSRPAVRPGSTAMPMPSGPLGAAARETGLRSAVGTPVIVEGRLWGVMAALFIPGAAAAGGHRGAPGLVHRAGGDGDRERREPRRSGPAGRGAGGVAAGRDAGGARGGAGGAIRGGHRGGRTAARRAPRRDGPLRE